MKKYNVREHIFYQFNVTGDCHRFHPLKSAPVVIKVIKKFWLIG